MKITKKQKSLNLKDPKIPKNVCAWGSLCRQSWLLAKPIEPGFHPSTSVLRSTYLQSGELWNGLKPKTGWAPFHVSFEPTQRPLSSVQTLRPKQWDLPASYVVTLSLYSIRTLQYTLWSLQFHVLLVFESAQTMQDHQFATSNTSPV